jgi:hypothetical protein
MANTKIAIIDAIVSELNDISGITLATRDLLKPAEQRANAPYVGVISTNEIVLVDDGTNIRWACDLEMMLVQPGDDIEKLVDLVRDAMLDGMAATVGAKDIRLVGLFEVTQVEADEYSSTRILFEMVYVSAKGAA